MSTDAADGTLTEIGQLGGDFIRDSLYPRCSHCSDLYTQHIKPSLKCPFEASTYKAASAAQRMHQSGLRIRKTQ